MVVLASPTLIAYGNYDQKSGLGAMLPQAPQQGPPGSLFTVRAGGFRSFALVESIKLGGIEVLMGNRSVNTDADGNLIAERLVVPGLDPGIYSLVVTVGSGIYKTTSVSTFEITAHQQNASSVTPSSGLAPLLDADNLVRIFNFENSTKMWRFYDPRPAFAAANTLGELRDRDIYWIEVRRDQEVTLNGKPQRVTCTNEGTLSEDCWNLLVW